MNIKQIIDFKKIGKEKLLLLGLAGILFLAASYFESVGESQSVQETTAPIENQINNYQREAELKIKSIVETIKGVKDVSVVVTLKSGKEKVVQEDSENSISNNEGGSNNSSLKKSTVIISQDGNDAPYVIKEIYPEVEGIAVTARGVSKENKESQIISMLSALYNVPVHKVSVIEID